MTEAVLPVHLFAIACKHCGKTLATLDLRTNDVTPMPGIVLIYNMRHWHYSFWCPDCEKTRILTTKAIGLKAGDRLWFGREDGISGVAQ